MEIENNNVKTLFHGLDGSRTVKQNTWLKANVKMGRDGKSKSDKDNYYLTGWHTLPSIEIAKKYLGNFKSRLDKLIIIECEIKGDIRKKPSNDTVVLSEWIKLGKIIEV